MTIWYLARSTGMVALIAFTVATVLGALATRTSRQPSVRGLDRRYLTQMAHRSAAILGLLMLTAHAALITIDSYVDVSLGGVLVPFTAGYRPLALGAGTVAVYAFILVAVSGALRGRLAASPAAVRAWRAIHLSAYAGWGLAMAHGIFAGTDTGASWSTAVYACCATAVIAALVVRSRSARTTPKASVSGSTLVRRLS